MFDWESAFGKDVDEVIYMMEAMRPVKELTVPAEALYDRLLAIPCECMGQFRDEQQHDDASLMTLAMPIVAYYHMSAQQRSIFLRAFRDEKTIYHLSSETPILKLTPKQAQILSRILKLIDIDYDPEDLEISYAQMEIDLARRVRERTSHLFWR